MLENIRENSQGVIAKVILGLVILTFAVAGIGSYTNSVDTSVAEVNGEKISLRTYEQAYQAQRSRMQQQFGEMFDTLAANPDYMANFRNGVVENLINEKLLDQNAHDLALRVSDARLKEVIRNMPEFQVDGKFDNNRYLAIIQQSGFFQSSDFRDYLRTEIIRRQLTQALVATEFSTPYQVNLQQSLQNQLRDIRFAIIAAAQFKDKVSVSDAEIKTYYQTHHDRFQTQEQVKIDYITLSADDLSNEIQVTEDDINNYYQENIARYTQPEQRRVAHILIEFGDDQAAAKKQAENLLAKLKQGEDFAKLAQEYSADTISGENGGDLDWIEKGAMDEAFDDAAFALKEVGQMSGIVKSSFGFHIIKLTDLKPEQVKPLADIKEELKIKLAKEKAQEKFFELQQQLAQVSFEYPDSLDDAAAAVNAEVKTSNWLTRAGNSAPFDNPKVIDAIFSDVVLTEGLNSDVIEIGDDLAIVVRLNEYQEAKIKPLAEVSEQIKAMLIAEKATQQTQTKANELLAALKSSANVDEILSSVNTTFTEKPAVSRYGVDVDTAIVKAAFVLPHPEEGKVSASTAMLANGDLAVVQVTAVKEGDVKADPNLTQQITAQLAQSAYQNYIETLKAEAKIIRKEVKAPENSF